jgi:hypothetical protein
VSRQAEDLTPASPNEDGIAQYDGLPIWRCPQLGGPVEFAYCRRMNQSLPCGRLAMCWGERIGIPAFLEEHYTTDEITQIVATATRSRMDIVSQTLQRVLGQRSDAK